MDTFVSFFPVVEEDPSVFCTLLESEGEESTMVRRNVTISEPNSGPMDVMWAFSAWEVARLEGICCVSSLLALGRESKLLEDLRAFSLSAGAFGELVIAGRGSVLWRAEMKEDSTSSRSLRAFASTDSWNADVDSIHSRNFFR